MNLVHTGLAMLASAAVAACSGGGDDTPASGGAGADAGRGGDAGDTAGNGESGASGASGAAGRAGAGGVAASDSGVGVGMPAGSGGSGGAIARPSHPSPVLSQMIWGCAIRDDGTMVCWDDNLVDYPLNALEGVWDAVVLDSDVGLPERCAHMPAGGYVCSGSLPPPMGREYVQIVLGAIHPFGMGQACGLLADGAVECWGEPAVTGTPAGAFVQLDARHPTFCGLRSDGTGECWNENTEFRTFPENVRFRQISVGPIFMCGVTDGAQLSCWGSAPPTAPTTDGVRMVSVAERHACALLENGDVECFGEFPFDYQGPPAGEVFELIDAGDENDCGVKQDGQLWCWGAGLPAREMRDGQDRPIVLDEL